MLVETSQLPTELIPAIVFLVAAGLSFSIGTAWGTFGFSFLLWFSSARLPRLKS